jgi:hypothetical protein
MNRNVYENVSTNSKSCSLKHAKKTKATIAMVEILVHPSRLDSTK